MSCLLNEERKGQLFDQCLDDVEKEFPLMAKFFQEDEAARRAENLFLAEQSDDEYNSYFGHPSLTTGQKEGES